ncbi:FO synthase [Limibacillus sp. MBR-115]
MDMRLETDKPSVLGRVLSDGEARELAGRRSLAGLMTAAGHLRDQGFGERITYSRKVFIPLSQLCRDVCHYCTFAKAPRHLKKAFLKPDEVLEIARRGAQAGCKEALFTLGDKPEARYEIARQELATLGHRSTLSYLAEMGRLVLKETGLLPHFNPGLMTAEDLAMLRPHAASMGIMLETVSDRLSERGNPHFGSPDKYPAARLAAIEDAGKAKVPFTTGLLVGIGETREEIVEGLLAIRRLHEAYGHIQEVIIQNFLPKPGTKMADAPASDLETHLWAIAVARLILGPEMSIQAPPNLRREEMGSLIDAGINDWGGVSPITPDHVNPEAPWPHLEDLATKTAQCGKVLTERLTVYPQYVKNGAAWLDPELRSKVLPLVDAAGELREDDWITGISTEPPAAQLGHLMARSTRTTTRAYTGLMRKAGKGMALTESEVASLFEARGRDFSYLCRTADEMRAQSCGDAVSFVVNRNINYTNICYFKCQFCAFSKGKMSENLRGRPYELGLDEIVRRSREAWDRGASEVCLQGGIHPKFTGETYLSICRAIREALPQMHIHAFSPLEIWQGAATLGKPLDSFLAELKEAGLNTLPGTAAEILDDAVRATLCPDKINTEQWLSVMRAAHAAGLKTTATIMFGHIDDTRSWARHLLHIRALQEDTGGFTEFVPLPFVASEAPIYLKGRARRGPTFRESVLMHAVARIVFHGLIDNIQTSWVKMGRKGAQSCLQAGANDLGGTLMDETITRSAGASHGQEVVASDMESLIAQIGRRPWQRSTCYEKMLSDRPAAVTEAAWRNLA